MNIEAIGDFAAPNRAKFGYEPNEQKPGWGRILFDRSGVLSVGILVGAILGLSFKTDGKPLAWLLGSDAAGLETAPQIIPVPPVGACTDSFPFSSRVISTLRANGPIRIGVFGDSFGDGVWAGTVQQMRGQNAFQLFRFSKESTGLTRYGTLNMLKDAEEKVAGQPIDIALINFGTNDTQGVWSNGRAAPYMSAAWQNVIGERATELVKMLENKGAAVGWVGLPRMRDEKFDRQIQSMNAFYASLMCRLHVPFVNPVGVSEDANHQFAKELIDDETGQAYLARANDGIHMSPHGYRVLARPLLKRIELLAPGRAF
jgi:lysophospholipase L1-like esterase